MKTILLWAWATNPIPIPTCFCDVCKAVRREKGKYMTWPSLYIDNWILIDTPQAIRDQLNRENVSKVTDVFFTHWHPDHTNWISVFEDIFYSKNKCKIKVYLPTNMVDDFKNHVQDLFYYEKQWFIEIKYIQDRKPININDVTITPLDMYRPDRVRYNYLLGANNKKILYAPCSCFEMHIDENYYNIDYFFLEYWWLWDSKKLRADYQNWINNFEHRSYVDHISFDENIEVMKHLKPKHMYLIHWNYHDTYRELDDLSKKFGVEFPFDWFNFDL